ncbi:hypothetical protein GPJ56_006758 [Histomonas meleagridis]|uniref:uncharacterized protein n=1 Tax=Histomonas meleagridis TaxID=135588 RepID=UPI00355A5FF7|nr:hypothetical protein GPJ56_006758 [Histomonas meleagridis]KAH0802153.1 hypothetical protein GO595_005012 [Histomonas meleagridis]
MPVERALPDFIADSFKQYGMLRNSPSYMDHQPADIVSVTVTALAIALSIFRYDLINLPKLACVYALSLHLRTLLFTVTTLPPTCIGYKNCKCHTIPYPTVSKMHSIPKIAFIYTFAMGLFLNEVPQCGDLTMSGHTTYLWVVTRYLFEILDKIFFGKMFNVIKFLVYTILSLVLITIIMIRNHYTIDIILGTVFTNIIWELYSKLQAIRTFECGDFENTFLGKFINWMEKGRERHTSDVDSDES